MCLGRMFLFLTKGEKGAGGRQRRNKEASPAKLLRQALEEGVSHPLCLHRTSGEDTLLLERLCVAETVTRGQR